MRLSRLLILCVLFATCQSEVERLHGESLYHLKNVIEILEKSAGDTDRAFTELGKYYDDHYERIIDVKFNGSRELMKLSEHDRMTFQTMAEKKSRLYRERIENLARTYPEPAKILNMVRKFL
ncbi:MAG: hypothetical protein FJ088_08715 [Deltaproteobacteria bacterium]|nr:hypothetical protein [Deltaproteobacteria bacterium]